MNTKIISIVVSVVFSWTNCIFAYCENISYLAPNSRFADRPTDTCVGGHISFDQDSIGTTLGLPGIMDAGKLQRAIDAIIEIEQYNFLAMSLKDQGRGTILTDLDKRNEILTHEVMETTDRAEARERSIAFKAEKLDPYTGTQLKVLLITCPRLGRSYVTLKATHHEFDGTAVSNLASIIVDAYSAIDKGKDPEIPTPGTASLRRVFGDKIREVSDPSIDTVKAFMREEKNPLRHLFSRKLLVVFEWAFLTQVPKAIGIALLSYINTFDMVIQLVSAFRDLRSAVRAETWQPPELTREIANEYNFSTREKLTLPGALQLMKILLRIIIAIAKKFSYELPEGSPRKDIVEKKQVPEEGRLEVSFDRKELDDLKVKLSYITGLKITMNDVFLALYARSLEREFGYSMPIFIPVDLRKMNADGFVKNPAISNVTGPQFAYFGPLAHLSLEESIVKVSQSMNAWGRRTHRGLTILPSAVAYLTSSVGFTKWMASVGMSQDYLPVLTNMGRVGKPIFDRDPKSQKIIGVKISDAQLTVSINGEPKTIDEIIVHPPAVEGPFPVVSLYTVGDTVRANAVIKGRKLAGRSQNPRRVERPDSPKRVLKGMQEDLSAYTNGPARIEKLKGATPVIDIVFKLFFGMIFVFVGVYRTIRNNVYMLFLKITGRGIKGTTWLVTGGTDGLGLEMVKIALKEGTSTVVVASRKAVSHPEWMNVFTDEERQRIKPIYYDAEKEMEAALLEQTKTALGNGLPDFLVLNAGMDIDPDKPESIGKGWKVNTRAPIALAKLFRDEHAKDSSKQRHIVAIGSTAAKLRVLDKKIIRKLGGIGVEIYGRTKQAVENSLFAKRNQRPNLLVTSASPGVFRTKLLGNLAKTMAGDFVWAEWLAEFLATDPKAVAMNVVIDSLLGKQKSWPTWDGLYAKFADWGGRVMFVFETRLGSDSEKFDRWLATYKQPWKKVTIKKLRRFVQDFSARARRTFPERMCEAAGSV